MPGTRALATDARNRVKYIRTGSTLGVRQSIIGSSKWQQHEDVPVLCCVGGRDRHGGARQQGEEGGPGGGRERPLRVPQLPSRTPLQGRPWRVSVRQL